MLFILNLTFSHCISFNLHIFHYPLCFMVLFSLLVLFLFFLFLVVLLFDFFMSYIALFKLLSHLLFVFFLISYVFLLHYIVMDHLGQVFGAKFVELRFQAHKRNLRTFHIEYSIIYKIKLDGTKLN